jgi:integrase
VKFTRRRYQLGSLFREKRKTAPFVWVFRWREDTPKGRVNRKAVVGTVEQLSTKAAALRAAESLRILATSCNSPVPASVGHLVRHYTDNELPKKASSNQRTLQTVLRLWVAPKWAGYRLTDVHAVEVENWLHELPLANSTKAKLRNVMHAIFAHACRNEWTRTNPIAFVRQSEKRTKTPIVLEPSEISSLLAALQNPVRALVFLVAGTGLRISEALGLKWSDLDFATRVICLHRSVVHQQIGNMKTETSRKPIPMDGALAVALAEWSTQTRYHQPQDWVFASSKKEGTQPYWPEGLLERHVKPAAMRLGIAKQIGWHSFRRTFATILTGIGEDVKTVLELMRHANCRLTLDVYAQGISSAKRAAHLKIVNLLEPRIQQNTGGIGSCSLPFLF